MGRGGVAGLWVLGVVLLYALSRPSKPEPVRRDAPVAATLTAAPVTLAEPPPSTCTVRAGDGWFVLANRGHLSLEAILAANEATVDTVIHPGDKVRLPKGASCDDAAATVAAIATAPAFPVGTAKQPAPIAARQPVSAPDPFPVGTAEQPAPIAARQPSSPPDPVPVGNILFAGNGGGPTLCADGSVSGSAGSGTCSHHGGESGGRHHGHGGGHRGRR